MNVFTSILTTLTLLAATSAHASLSSAKIDATGKCLDINGASNASGVQLQEWDCNGSNAQSLSFIKQSDGLYEIRTQTGSNLCLDISGANPQNLTAVQQYSCNATKAQRFDVRARGSGYEIRPSINLGSCLDVTSGNPNNGTKIIEYSCNGGANQLFHISLAAAPVATPVPTPVPVPANPSAFKLVSPANAAQVVGQFQITGTVGTNWKNIAAYDINNNYAKVATDVTPANGQFALSADSTKIANGSARIAIIAFSVAAGATGGSSNALELDINVANPVVSGSARPAPISGAAYSDYVLTFEDTFQNLNSISAGDTYNGAKWYNGVEQCCMVDSTGLPGVMFPTAVNGVQVNPYSITAGGGLSIALVKQNNVWYSGVLTSVDKNKQGFTQKYGYYEMKAQQPAGEGVWPAFWMLSTQADMPGEIDMMEYYGVSKGTSYGITLHDWRNGGNNTNIKNPQFFPTTSGLTDGYHTYGMLWTASTMTFFLDGAQVWQTPTPDVMQQPYYLLVNNGLGGYWPTQNTPQLSQFKVQYIRAYGQKP